MSKGRKGSKRVEPRKEPRPKRAVVSIGCELAGGLAEYVPYSRKISLLDWDIIIFNPRWPTSLAYSSEDYLGKPTLTDTASFHLRELVEHWRRELGAAYEAGKTIVIFLTEPQEVFVATGERTFSGTGRNRQTTRIVSALSNYKELPLAINVTLSEGKAMNLTQDGSFLSDYWKRFGKRSVYKILMTGKVGRTVVSTRSGGKTVGSIAQHQESSGAFLLLPYLDLEAEDLWDENVSDNDEVTASWNEEGLRFGRTLLHCLLEIDRFLHETSGATPAPEWAATAEFALVKEGTIQESLLKLEVQIEKLQLKKEGLRELFIEEGALRRLLYEKGTPLERAITEGLLLMGFRAAPYKETDSEFDVVFESPEGRFLGEAEGKDNKAVNIDKLRQLIMNLHEDFEREDVKEMAKGVLFGNAYRLLPPGERGEFFTEKCVTAAKREGIALVRTPDLFQAAKYLRENHDEAFAKTCREAILQTSGTTVEFPVSPSTRPPTASTNAV